ncbi:ABC transporter ATP-binding protein [Blautia obeum]|uniref:Putative ABC transporter ATP-binding protein YxlF n=1 Tax=Blautia obeum TaxID=40520 RepID=A0A564TFS1_9FIRM|nr:ABC transporter ATP-binding protein [Blautia obeum]VUX06248.1 putative ABC transporter ATP-binding protein YxlF [Blautia obeum]
MIEVRNLTKKYGDHFAIQDISFSLEKGKIYGLLGPNGAGKSTTMNIMTGYIAATSGEVIIEGHDIFKEAEEAKKHIGYLPEIPPLYMDMTVWEYLFTVADLKGVPKSERKSMIGDVMEKVMLTNMKDRLIKNLSKGYKQRVGIAQTLIGNPDIIILDEPTVGLDPKQIIEIRTLIKRLGEDHTVLISSHILSEIGAVCDHVVIINKGHLVVSDSTENLEKLFKGQDILCLSAQGELEKIQNILREFPALSIADMKEAEEAETYRFQLKVQDQADYRKQLFFRFAEAGIPLLEISRAGMSLEDIFLEITEEGRA